MQDSISDVYSLSCHSFSFFVFALLLSCTTDDFVGIFLGQLEELIVAINGLCHARLFAALHPGPRLG